MSKKLLVISALAFAALFMTGTAWADNIPITNASFETHDPFTSSCGPGCGYNSGSIPGWTVTNGGSFQPGAFYSYIPDGSVIGFTNGGTISQVLTGTSVLANSSYTLTVDVGNRQSPSIGGTFTLSLDTILNGAITTLCSISGNAATFAAGTWQAESCTYQSGSTAPDGNFYLNFVSGTGQLNIDNVTLSDPSTNVPEPSSLLLLAVGAMLVLSAAMWSKKRELTLSA